VPNTNLLELLQRYRLHCELVHLSGTCTGICTGALKQRLNHTHTHTHAHLFNGPFSGTTRVSQYQKGKTNQDFTEPRDSEWQWLQTDNHVSTPPLSFFTGRMPFLPPNQQNQCTEGTDALNALPLQCADAVGWCNG